jgi:hypothetical protein
VARVSTWQQPETFSDHRQFSLHPVGQSRNGKLLRELL